MNTAVIGWGSLIWCPGNLRISSRWHKDGPLLPIEFSRVSDDGRLTLVIVSGAIRVPALWATSQYTKVDDAKENLRSREGTSPGRIASVSVNQNNLDDEILISIRDWLVERSIDAAVWTALPPRTPQIADEPVDERAITPDEAVRYIRLNSKNREKMSRIEEYIRNAPEQIETQVRKRLREEFDWVNNPLSPILFEE